MEWISLLSVTINFCEATCLSFDDFGLWWCDYYFSNWERFVVALNIYLYCIFYFVYLLLESATCILNYWTLLNSSYTPRTKYVNIIRHNHITFVVNILLKSELVIIY